MIKATSLLDGYEMTPLDHLSPAAVMIDPIRYAQQHIEDDDDTTNLCEDNAESKNSYYKF